MNSRKGRPAAYRQRASGGGDEHIPRTHAHVEAGFSCEAPRVGVQILVHTLQFGEPAQIGQRGHLPVVEIGGPGQQVLAGGALQLDPHLVDIAPLAEQVRLFLERLAPLLDARRGGRAVLPLTYLPGLQAVLVPVDRRSELDHGM